MPVSASFIVNPLAVATAAGSASVTVTGKGTNWTSSAGLFTAATGTISSIVVTSFTKATFNYAAPDLDQTDIITDTSTGFQQNLIVSSHETLLDQVNWITGDMLKRTDLQQAVIDAVTNFYTLMTRKVAFDEYMYTSAEYNMTQGQPTYNFIGLQPPIWPPLDAISSIRLTYGPQGPNSNSVRLRRSSVRLYDAISVNFNSRPSTYSRWGTSFEVNPRPDSNSYTFRVRYRGKAILNNPNPENTIILVDGAWNELIRWEGLYRAYYYLGMYDQAMMLVTPPNMPRQPSPRRQVMFETGIIPRLWNDLLSTISAKEAPDEDFGINPVVRSYSQNS